ncbi:RCC1 and BTB domain-containing protein 1 [Folsomia candida]|uniref:RCC1 and BTB domain-containing protein 1 n=1 Tax=Folsomia candida TaxID=158441 RepID=UPI0016050B4F|nr:RCC1 and BTB domain-containing protein 1 [Folsomia candida]
MESPTSGLGIIPEKQLKIWKIFRNVGPDGEEILKTAKLAHSADYRRGFVVTMNDETYSFFRKDSLGGGVCTISKIDELSGVRVKEFFTGTINFAITDEGRLFSWFNELDTNEFYPPHHIHQLGRGNYVSGIKEADQRDLFCRPALVTGSLTGVKVRQIALQGWTETYTVAVSVGGEVHHWGATYGSGSEHPWIPSLIPKEHFDYQEVISVTCSDRMGVALTSKGELFQWEVGDKVPKKVFACYTFKKITGNSDFIFALTVTGEMQYLEPLFPWWRRPPRTVEWMTIEFEDHKIEDIASCNGDQNVVVVELKNSKRFAFHYCEGENHEIPALPTFTLPSDASMDGLFAKYGGTSYRTISVQIEPPPRRRVKDDICDLWENKKHADVAFSVEGKVITAHKLILSGRSEYFERMFSKEWNEANPQKGAIEVKDTKHDIFEALLFYIYTDKIKFEEDEHENIFELMKLADYYCLVDIRHECEKILINNINPENAFFLAKNASSANALTLEGKVIKFIVDNQLLVDISSPQEKIGLVGMKVFQQI